MSRKICSWLTVIVRLLRGTRQASGGRHFEDFTYYSSLRNAFTTFQHLLSLAFSPSTWRISNNETRESFSNALSPARKGGKSRRDRLGFIALRTAGFEDGRTNGADCCQSIFKRCQAARYFRWQRATRVRASFFNRFHDIRVFSLDIPAILARNRTSATPWNRRHSVVFSPIFHFYSANSWSCSAG